MIARSLILTALLVSAGCSSASNEPAAAETTTPSTVGARVVIDTRHPEQFAQGHDEGALNLQWGWDQLEGRVRSYLPDLETSIAVRAKSDDDAAKAKGLLEEYGYEDVVVLTGPLGKATLPVMTCEQLAARIAAGDAPTIIDVRTPGEWANGVIEGAVTVEQDKAPELVPELDPAQEYAIICAGGFRSGQFASLLRQRGFENVTNVIDGMSAWYKR